ncbi:MAG: hypothetical protein ACTSXW_00170 [Candidatus Baldrarchaeia archaeon]
MEKERDYSVNFKFRETPTNISSIGKNLGERELNRSKKAILSILVIVTLLIGLMPFLITPTTATTKFE